jgi:hypothetical protein
MTAKTAAANIHRSARWQWAKRAVGEPESVIFFPVLAGGVDDFSHRSNDPVPRFIVANCAPLCHKPSLHRPADQGLPWRCPCWLFRFGNNSAFSTL